MKTINTRVNYSYFDYKEGMREGFIDLDLVVDHCNEIIYPTEKQLQKYVARKWKNCSYKGGDLASVELKYID